MKTDAKAKMKTNLNMKKRKADLQAKARERVKTETNAKLRVRVTAVVAAILSLCMVFAALNPRENAELPNMMNLSASSESEGSGDIIIISANFPDANVRSVIKSCCDTDGDEVLSLSEREAVTELSFTNNKIADVTGIEYFPNLTSLTVSCYNLTYLDLSKNTALEELYCTGTSIVSLDLSANVNLRSVDCSCSTDLSEIIFGKHTELNSLNIRKTAIAELDLSGCPLMTEGSVLYSKAVSIIWYTEPDPIVVSTVSVPLDGSIGLSFWFEASLLPDDCTAGINKGDDCAEISLADATAEFISETEYTVFTYENICPDEICDTVSITLYSDGEAISEEYSDSVQSCVMKLLNEAENKTVQSYLESLLNYGYAAQAYFGDENGDSEEADSSETADLYEGEKYIASSLILENRLYFSLLFDIEPTDESYATVRYESSENGETVAVQIRVDTFDEYPTDDGEKTYYAVTFEIPISDIDAEISVKVMDGETELATVTDSPSAYMDRLMNRLRLSESSSDSKLSDLFSKLKDLAEKVRELQSVFTSE